MFMLMMGLALYLALATMPLLKPALGPTEPPQASRKEEKRFTNLWILFLKLSYVFLKGTMKRQRDGLPLIPSSSSTSSKPATVKPVTSATVSSQPAKPPKAKGDGASASLPAASASASSQPSKPPKVKAAGALPLASASASASASSLDVEIDALFAGLPSKKAARKAASEEEGARSAAAAQAARAEALALRARLAALERAGRAANQLQGDESPKPLRFDAALGVKVFSVDALKIGAGNGDTADCPFDCQCCF